MFRGLYVFPGWIVWALRVDAGLAGLTRFNLHKIELSKLILSGLHVITGGLCGSYGFRWIGLVDFCGSKWINPSKP